MDIAGKSRVLIVDDTPQNIHLLMEMLKGEYVINAAINGEKALKLASAQQAPDIILLDVMMPEMDGYEVCAKLKADEKTKNIPVIFITALTAEESEAKGLALGAIDYITKPFNPAIVKTRVHNHLELKKKTDELVQAHNLLAQAEKMVALGQLVAGVAHELNTPAGVALTAASFLAETRVKFMEKYETRQMTKGDLENFLKVCKESTEIILLNIMRGSELIKSFKQVAVDQSSEQQRLFNIKEYIEQILLSLTPNFKNNPHKITLNCDDNIMVDSYPGAISQVITNLLMNSIVHAFEENDCGNITIDVSSDANKLIIHYADDGKGISEECLNKIYEPFFTTKRGSGGAGLGLNIVYNIVTQKLGGSIKCSSKLGQGTIFAIELPRER